MPEVAAENTLEVLPGLWTSGQLSAEEIDRLPAEGFRAVINLALPDSVPHLPGEAARVTGLGMTYVHIPVPWEAPTANHLAQFCAVMHAFTGQSVWVHCAKNMRVSAFVYLYRCCVLGEAEATAREALLRIWMPNETWQQFINQQLTAHDITPL